MALPFVNSSNPPRGPAIKGRPKLYHKKSRYGCRRCKERKVKCDEGHPICKRCQRHNLQCSYDRFEWQSHSSEDKMEPGELVESKSRRLLELRLYNHFVSEVCPTLLISHDATTKEVWAKIVPRLALGNTALLYGMHAFAAAHLARIDRHDVEALEAHQEYLALTVREHQSDISSLSKANADEVCMTSTVLRLCASVLLQERQLGTCYTPPMDWIRVTSGGAAVFRTAWKYISDHEQSAIGRLRNKFPIDFLDRKNAQKEIERLGMAHLLRSPAEIAADPWPAETHKAYEAAIYHLGQIVKAMADGELPEVSSRRVMVFPMHVKEDFFALVEHKHPRALLLLAHYFALLAKFRQVWWIGDAGRREVHAIQAHLSDEWQEFMSWPLLKIQEPPVDVVC